MKKLALRGLDACDAVSARDGKVVMAAASFGYTLVDLYEPPGSGGRGAVLYADDVGYVMAFRGSGSEDKTELARNVQDDAFAVPLRLPKWMAPRAKKARGHAGLVRHAEAFRDWAFGHASRLDLVTGFSLGCACSEAIALGMAQTGFAVRNIGFAGPRLYDKNGSKIHGRKVETTHFVLPGDVVPTVPPAPLFRHVPGKYRLPWDFPDLAPEHSRPAYRRAIEDDDRIDP